MNVCANCGDPVKEHSRKTNPLMPYYCMKAECRKERNKVKGQLQFRRWRERHPIQVRHCVNCGDTIQQGLYCRKPQCRAVRKAEANKATTEVPPESRDVYMPIVKLNKSGSKAGVCERCRWETHCVARVKVALWLACERADERDKKRLELSDQRADMLKLLDLARAY